MSELKDRAAKGIAWAAINNMAMQVLNAVFGIVLARLLTESDYGLIGMLTIFTLIANSLQDSGFVTALTNRTAPTHEDYNAVFWFNIVVSASMYVIFFFCAPLIADFYNEPLLTPLSRYYFLGFFIASFSIVPRAILFKQLKQKKLAVMGLLALIVSGTVGITMAFNGMAYWGLATQTLTFNLMVSLLSWWLSGFRPTRLIPKQQEQPLPNPPQKGGNLKTQELKNSLRPIREMFGFSSKMLITNIFVQINNNIFSIVLGKFYTKNEVGRYNQANKWNLMGASTITGMVQGVAQPTFVEVGDDKERLCRAFSKMLRFTSFVSFPVMFGLALVAPEFITVFITKKWLSSAELMQMLCIGGAFLPISTLYYNLIISRGKSNIYMWNIISQGIIILTAIIGIHYIGGGVRSMVMIYVEIIILWVLVWHYFLHREIGYPLWQALRDILPFAGVAALTMFVTGYATSGINNLYLLLASRIVIAAIIYIGALWFFGARILKESVEYVFKRK